MSQRVNEYDPKRLWSRRVDTVYVGHASTPWLDLANNAQPAIKQALSLLSSSAKEPGTRAVGKSKSRDSTRPFNDSLLYFLPLSEQTMDNRGRTVALMHSDQTEGGPSLFVFCCSCGCANIIIQVLAQNCFKAKVGWGPSSRAPPRKKKRELVMLIELRDWLARSIGLDCMRRGLTEVGGSPFHRLSFISQS